MPTDSAVPGPGARGGFRAMIPTVIVALAGAVLLHAALRGGAGVSPDSVQYLTAAGNLLAGNGLAVLAPSGAWEPLSHFPPLYPVALAALARVAGSTWDAASLLNPAAFAAAILLMGLLAGRAAGTAAAIAAAVAGAVSFPLVTTCSWVWSETLFLPLVLACLLLLSVRLAGGKGWTLVAAAALAAAATLTRYAGFSVALAGVATLAFGGRVRGLRLRDTALFGVIATLPVAAWVLRPAGGAVAGDPSPRSAALHPVTWSRIAEMLGTLGSWVLPERWTAGGWGAAAGTVVLVAAVAGALWWLGRGDSGWPRDRGTVALVAVFGACYVGALLVSLTLFDAYTPLDDRILSPLYCVLAVLGGAGVARAWRAKGAGRWCAVAVVVGFLALHATQSAAWIGRVRGEGLGYAQAAWRFSPTMARLAALPPETPIYTNAPDVVLFLGGRRAAMLPLVGDPVTRRPNAGFAGEVAAMGEALRRTGGVLVYFRALSRRTYLPTPLQLHGALPLVPVETLPDGTVYRVR